MSKLASNQNKWTSANITSYRYTFKIGCFCPEGITTPVIIEVRNGTRTSITRPSGIIDDPERFYPYDTIEKVFQMAEKTLKSKAEEVKVEYNSTFGYPTLIGVDVSKQIYDEEMSFSIIKFEKM